MFIIPSIDLSMKLSLSEVFVSNIIVTMVVSNKSCCKHVLFTKLSDFISATTRVTSVKSKKFLFSSFSVAKFGINRSSVPPYQEHKLHCVKMIHQIESTLPEDTSRGAGASAMHRAGEVREKYWRRWLKVLQSRPECTAHCTVDDNWHPALSSPGATPLRKCDSSRANLKRLPCQDQR